MNDDPSILSDGVSLRRLVPFILVFLAIAAPYFDGGRQPLAILLIVSIPVLAALLVISSGEEWFSFPPVGIAWGAVVTAAVISTVVSPVLDEAIGRVLFYLALGTVILVGLQISSAEARRLRDGIIAAGLALLAFGYYTYLQPETWQLTSTYYNPNAFAGFLLLTFGPLLALAVAGKAPASRALAGLAGAFVVYSIFLTGSRGALAGLVVAGVAVLLLVKRRRRGKRWTRMQVVVGVAVCLLGATITGGLAALNVASIGDGISASLKEEPRLMYWSGASAIGTGSPVIGAGTAGFARLYPQVQESVLGFSRDAHSKLFESFAETGLVGLVAFGFFMLVVLWTGWKAALYSESEDFPVSLGTFAGSAGFLAHSSIDFQWLFPANVLIFFMLVALSARALRRPVTATVSARVVLPALLVLMLLVGLARYSSAAQVEGGLLAGSALDPKGAESRFRAATIFDPLSPSARYYLGLAIYHQGTSLKGAERVRSIGRARKEVETALRLDPLNPLYVADLARFDLAEADLQRGGRRVELLDRAVRLLREAHDLDRWNRPGVALELATALDKRGDDKGARAVLGQIVERYPLHTLTVMKGWFAGNMSEKELQDRAKGSPELKEKLGGYFETAAAVTEAHVRLARWAEAEGRLESAHRHLQTANAISPDNRAVKTLLDSVTKRLRSKA